MAAYLLDSCVLISASNQKNTDHELAKAVLARIRSNGDQAAIAATSIWDLVGTLLHPGKPRPSPLPDAEYIEYDVIPVTFDLFVKTAKEAPRLAMKGPDLVILSCAKYREVPLISSDPAMLKHGASYGVTVLSMADYLAR